MKLLEKMLAGTALALATLTTHAAIIQPAGGDGELMVVLHTIGNDNSFVLDLGITFGNFDTTTNQSFNLSASP
jgi:hypothetical protein